jgi:DNA-binding transcriptional LysR family regulator
VLRVSAPVALGRQQIVPRLAGFLRAYPQVRVELELSDRLVAMAQEGFDVALRHTAAPPDTHVAWPLCTTRSWLVASRAYLRRAGAPATPAELAMHDCLHYLRPGDTPTWSFEPDAARAGRPAVPGARVSVAVRGVFAANNSEALRELALAGCGIALLPDFSAARDVAAGRLTVVLPGWRSVGAFGSRIHAIRPYSPQVPRAVQAFVAFLREAMKGGFGQPA